MAGFGTPKYGNKMRPIPKELLGKEGGSITFRILPPILTCLETGEWAVSHTQHFGYDTPNPSDPSKRIYHVFYCVEVIRWENGERVTVQFCPECEKIKSNYNDWVARKAQMEQLGKSAEEIAETLRPLSEWLKRHNRDFKWYINIKDASGGYSTRKVAGKYIKKPIDAIVKKFREKQTPWDPIAAHQGLWFTATKVGQKLSSEWTLEVQTEDRVIDGETLSKPKSAPLTEQDANEAEKLCCDLHDVGIRQLSYDKVKTLVDSGGDAQVIKALFGAAERESRPSVDVPSTTANSGRVTSNFTGQPGETTKPAGKVSPVEGYPKTVEPEPNAGFKEKQTASAAPADQGEDVDVAKAMKALVDAQARAKARATATPAPTTTTTTTAAVAPAASQAPKTASSGPGPDDDDDESFMAQFRT